MITDEEIDAALLANITNQWRKVAFVVGMTMMEIDSKQRVGRDDLYFAKRIAVLVQKGLIEHTGDLDHMRYCEVRLAPD
jgi:hypothetical protein